MKLPSGATGICDPQDCLGDGGWYFHATSQNWFLSSTLTAVLLLAPLQAGRIHCRVLNKVSCEGEPQSPPKCRCKHVSCQNRWLRLEGLVWLVSHAEEILSPFVALLELCHPSAAKANVTAVLFEAALINLSPQ